MVDDPSWDTGLASPEEEKLVVEFRNILSEKSLLDGPHADFPEVTGDYNLLRFLRGCERDLKVAVELFEKHIALRKEFNLDKMRERMVKLLDTKPLFGQEDLIHGEVFAKYFPNQLSAGESPTGHVIIYIPEGDHDTYKLMEHLTAEQIWATKLEDLILRQIQMDRLSRKYNRLMKQVVIVDCAGATMRNINNKTWAALDKDFNDRALTATHVEYVGRIFLINAPSIVRTLFALARPLIPKRTRERVFIYGRDYRTHIMNQISTRTLSTLLSFRKAKDNEEENNSMEGKNIEVKAGKIKEVLIEVDGEKISQIKWKFHAVTKDIVFSALFYRNSNNNETSNETGTVETPIVEETKVLKDHGEIIGEYNVKNGEEGLILFQWSNKHSWWNSNAFSYTLETVEKK
eukprot:g7517.t1